MVKAYDLIRDIYRKLEEAELVRDELKIKHIRGDLFRLKDFVSRPGSFNHKQLLEIYLGYFGDAKKFPRLDETIIEIPGKEDFSVISLGIYGNKNKNIVSLAFDGRREEEILEFFIDFGGDFSALKNIDRIRKGDITNLVNEDGYGIYRGRESIDMAVELMKRWLG